jgi:guanylate kinase
MKELESRLRGRNTETEDKIQLRLQTAIDEMAFGRTPDNFDAIITNDDVDSAYMEIFTMLKKWYSERLEKVNEI